jgi:hypothetical protein
MIKKIEIISTGKNKYLYENEVKILLKMLNNNIKKLQIKNKIFAIDVKENKTANVRIYKIQYVIFNKLVTELKIKYC